MFSAVKNGICNQIAKLDCARKKKCFGPKTTIVYNSRCNFFLSQKGNCSILNNFNNHVCKVPSVYVLPSVTESSALFSCEKYIF